MDGKFFAPPLLHAGSELLSDDVLRNHTLVGSDSGRRGFIEDLRFGRMVTIDWQY